MLDNVLDTKLNRSDQSNEVPTFMDDIVELGREEKIIHLAVVCVIIRKN